MKRLVFFCGWLLLAGGCRNVAPPPGPVRLGTFKRTDLVVAYYRSRTFDGRLRKMRAELEKAKAAGDEKRAAELEARAGAMQEVAHRQLAGKAPLTNIFEDLEAVLPEVAESAGVGVIAEECIYRAPAVEQVDITERLKAYLPPRR